MSNKPKTWRELNGQYPTWFRDWQKKFYKSKEWRKLREEILKDRGMISDYSHTLITGKAVVDHIIEITPSNYEDESITMGWDNLQLLSFEEHNRKTFGTLDKDDFKYDLDNRSDNLFT